MGNFSVPGAPYHVPLNPVLDDDDDDDNVEHDSAVRWFLSFRMRLTEGLVIRSPISRSGESSQRSILVYLSSVSTKEAQPEEDPSVSARLQRLQNNYEDFGMRRTVEGILVVHDHGHPHILMLQIANAFFKLYALFSLSGQSG